LSTEFSSSFLQPLRIIVLQTAGLVPPSVIRLLRDLQLPTHIADALPLGGHPVCLLELAHNLLRGVPLPPGNDD